MYVVKKKYLNPKDRQKEVNNFFKDTILELHNAIIDEAFDLCYEKYKLYPNVYAIKIMREQLNKSINVNVSIDKIDLIYIQ